MSSSRFVRRLTAGLALTVSLFFAGCATSMPRGAAERVASRPPTEQIRWPEAYVPERAVFFVHNQIDIQAPPEVVWAILTHVQAWPDWYVGATNVRVGSPDGRVGPGVVTAWRTMGLNFESHVKEFEPPTRFAWESRKAVIRGYHAWLIVPTPDGCRVITDEAFHGVLAYLQRAFIPRKLHGLHQTFLEELKKKAEAQVAAGR